MPKGIYKRTKQNKGWKLSEETRRKMSNSRRGLNTWSKGRKISDEERQKLSKIAKEKGFGKWMKGKHPSEETKKKVKEFWDKNRKKLNCLDCGIKLGRYNAKRCKSCYGKTISGSNAHNWKGGRKATILRRNGAGGYHTEGEWETMKAQYNFTCPSCKKSEPEISLTRDHIIPLSKGGSNNIENIQPLCLICNSKKATKTIKFPECRKRESFKAKDL